MFLCRTLIEKNAMITASKHLIFLEYCVTDEDEIWSKYSLLYYSTYKPNLMFLRCTVFEKNAMLTAR